MNGHQQKGFTLLELLVVLGIFVVMSTIVLVKNQQFSNALLINDVAYDIALSIREAQIASLAVSENPFSPEGFDAPFGVVFDKDQIEYSFGVDNDGDGKIGALEKTKTYTLGKGFLILDLCGAVATQGLCEPGINSDIIHVVFTRPDPDALIKRDNGEEWIYLEVHISSPDGSIAVVNVSNTGQISIE